MSKVTVIHLISELNESLATSDSIQRKRWAQQVCDNNIDLNLLIGILHADRQTAQRFTWLLGDICELQPSVLLPCLPLLFSLRDQMPFPGMHRSVAKWLWLTEIPEAIEGEAIPQLIAWLEDPEISIAGKSFAAKALFFLVTQERFPKARLVSALNKESQNENRAYASRMEKLLTRLA